MKSEKVKEMLDSCYMAKRILDMLPKLPEGVLPSYVRYLETIIELEEKNQKVKVSDVSEVLNLPRPGVTRTIHAMEEKGYLKKETAKHDGRVTYVTVTKEGKMITAGAVAAIVLLALLKLLKSFMKLCVKGEKNNGSL